MKLFLFALMGIGLALIVFGAKVSNGPGSADERVAGAIPLMLGVGFIVLAVVIAFVGLIFSA